MLPEGWKRVSLGEIAQISSGGTPDRSEPSYWGGDIPWVTTGEIQFNTIHDTTEKITAAGLKNSSAKMYRAGTLLMAMYGQGKTRGQVAKLGIDATTNQACAAISIGPGCDPEYVYQFLASQYNAIRELGNAGTQQNLNAGLIKEIGIPVPPMREQTRISHLARDWDAAIAASEQLLANSRHQKQALMQELFNDKKNLARCRTTWRPYRLNKLFTERVETNRPDLPLLSVTREAGVIPREDVGRKDTSNDDKSLYRRVCPGDIAYNTMRMWQGVSALSRLDGIVSPAYTVVVPNDLIHAEFAAHLFKHRPVVFLFYRYSQGLVSDTWNLKFSHFGEITVSIPDRNEQVAITAVLREVDAQIAMFQQQLDELRREKAALMADLLTGKRRVRLPELEPAALPA